MDLVRDVLDEQVVDRRERAVGKADRIVLELREGRAPRVVAVEIGGIAAARRLSPFLARQLVRLMHALGVDPVEPLRLALSDLKKEGVNLQADVEADDTPAYAWERWLRRRAIGRIPGAR